MKKFLLFLCFIALAAVQGWAGNNEIVWQIQAQDQVNGVKYSADGQFIFDAMTFIEQRSASNGALIRTFNDGLNDGINCFDISNDGKYLATCKGQEKYIRIWDITTGKYFKTLSDSINYPVNNYLSFSPDGTKLVVTGAFNAAYAIYVFDIQTGDILFEKFEHWTSDTARNWSSVVYAPNGKYFATSCSAPYTGVTVFDAITDTVICEFRNKAVDLNNTTPISISSDSKYVAFSYYDANYNGMIIIYDINNKILYKEYPIGQGTISFSHDDSYFIQYRTIYSFPFGAPFYTYQLFISNPCWSPDNKYVAGYFIPQGSAWGSIGLFNADLNILGISETKPIQKLKIINAYPNPTENILSIEFTAKTIDNIEISLNDINGNIVFHDSTNNSDKYNIETSGIPSGSYIVRLKQGNQISEKQIIIIK